MMIRKLTARDARLSSFRYYDLLVHVFVVILLISNLVGQKICAIPLFHFHGREIVASTVDGGPDAACASFARWIARLEEDTPD